MSVLVEIAEKADVSVEGVVRVLTREPVSDAIKERVLAVLDDLDPEQTRAVQRFALAALHDVLPRPLEPPAELVAASESAELPAARPDAVLVELSSVLTELAEAVRELRRETDAERRERVDDLAVLIDLITTGWQGLDGRLGRLERQLSRLEPARRPVAETRAIGIEPARIEAPRVEPTPVVAAPVVAAPGAAPPVETPPPPAATSGERDRLPLAAALSMGLVVVGTLAVMQLFSRGPDFAGLVSARETTATTTATTGASTSTITFTSSSTSARPPTTAKPRPPDPRPGATTSPVLGTAASETKPATTAPKAAPPTVTTTTAATPTGAAGFRPTRNWAWAPVQGADYYAVDFLRAGQSFYRATPTNAALTLPGTLVFRPGSYRWIVRPGTGERSARKLGEPIVDSPFTVTG